MNIKNLSPAQFERHRAKLTLFIQKNGDKRITKDAIEWVKRVNPTRLSEEETVVIVASEGNKVIGVLIAANYGIEEGVIVVDRRNRNHSIAKRMVQTVISQLNKIYGRIALDNIPSLKVCLDNGLVAFHLFEGPTGKPTVWVGGGEWTKEDVLN
ncbi:GNAT family N-acetyltransferase [Bacillus horti]|uniref:N-acetyltransferase domain-containing protein n=1 Tax=Caldalkalibacillus horti TaxID=77523 RepID=A0ABT9VWJ5_9BACI|nr:GNAT family N-acetyltransferase [Bacillus horti]MDQ0165182.1 hypothetical protein [Bacillus horti]